MKKIRFIASILAMCAFSAQLTAQSVEEAKKLTTSEQYALAEEMFKKLMVSEPTNGDVYYYYGENEIEAFFSDTITRTKQETILNCKKLFNKGIENSPQNPLNYIGLARLGNMAGDQGLVSENLAKVNTMIPAMTVKPKKVKEPARYAVIVSEMAKIYILPGKTDTTLALPLLRRAVSVDPKNADIFITMGDAYLNVRDVNPAISNYNQAQYINPNSPLAKLRIGYLYVRAKNLNAAISSLEESLRIDPKFSPAYKELGYVYSLAGRAEQSRNNYSKYLELSGGNIPAKINYVVSLYRSNDFKSCIKQINEIFKVDSSINSMNRVIGYCYFEEKQYVKAQYYMEKFFKNSNQATLNARDFVFYGKILGERGFADKADENLRKAIEMDASYVDLYSDIANYQNKAKNYKRAVAALEDKDKAKAAKIGDYYYLGRYYYNDGNYIKANETFDRLLNMNDPRVKPFEMPALQLQGYSLIAIDSTFSQGLAMPVYNKILEKALLEPEKNTRNIAESYFYMASYYFRNETEKDFGKAKMFFMKVLAVDPAHQQATAAMQHPDIVKAKLPEE
jgi:tetratricopeptide (TPR) repeat protein